MKRLVDGFVVEMGARARTEDEDLVIGMAFSSEEPAERWWGTEILDHGEGSIRLGRLNDGAPLLYNHDSRDMRGVHEPGTMKIGKDRVLRGQVRIAPVDDITRSTIKRIERRILTKASIGYRLHKVVEQTIKKSGEKVERELDGAVFERLIDELEARAGRPERRAFQRSLDGAVGALDRADDDEPVYRVMDWEPLENSLVPIPLDNTVGIGRSETKLQDGAASAAARSAVANATTRKATMKTAEELAAEKAAADEAQKKTERAAMEKLEREAREKLEQKSAQELEQGRIRAIENLTKANKIGENIRDAWVRQGYSLEQVSNDILKILEERGRNNPQPASRLGLTAAETQRFSLLRAISAVDSRNWEKAGFELECSKAVAQKLGKVVDDRRFYVPFEAMERQLPLPQERMLELAIAAAYGKRDLTVATAGAGGYLVQTDNQGFIEMLRNRMLAFRIGCRRLSGLQGSLTIPRQSAAATAVWLANEASTATESQQTFVQVAMSPKTVGAYTEISRQLLLQSSPGAEGIVTDDLAQVVAVAGDLAVFEGSGAGGQPLGLSGTSGIGSVTGTSLAAAGIIEFQTDVAGGNVVPMRPAYVTTPAVAGLLMIRPELPSTGTTRLWKGNIFDGSLFDLPAATSNQVTAATMVFGDWQEIVVGEWGVLEVEVNPYAGFQAGIVGVRALYSMDVGVRRPFAFSRSTSIT
jgi:HK97 family phage major capsid protein